MFRFALEIIMMVALGALLYLVARVLPRINDEGGGAKVIETHWSQPHLERVDVWLRRLGEKSLRRLQIILLRLDNVVRGKLEKFKKDSTPSEDENGGKLF